MFFKGLCRGSSHNFSCHGINPSQYHFFLCPVIADQEGECFYDDCLYNEYGHMGLQSGLGLSLDEYKAFLPEECLCF